jgi:very-short-patch-repair endonuclease
VVERGLECGLRRGDITVAEAYALAKRLQGRGRRGPGVLLEVVDRRPPGAPPTESDLETCLLQLSRRAGMSEPERQWELRANGRIYRLDFAWPDCRFALEGDGAETHATRRALVGDLRRQNQIVMGWLILRFAWEDVYLDAELTCQVIRDAWLYTLTGPTPSQLASWRSGANGAIRSN